MGSEQPAARTGAAPGDRASGSRPVRRLWTVLTASDPGLQRLRSAGTTVATLLVALGVLYGLVTVWSQPVTAAVLGVIVAMIASLAVNEPKPAQRAASIALLVPCAAASASLAAALSPQPVVADVVFVAVAVCAVFLRLLGPRGLAMGMIAFIAFFLTLFVQVTVGQLPVVIVSAAVGALVAFGMGMLLRPRHPDRDLRRMLSALGVRAGSVVEVLRRGFDQDGFGSWESSRLRSRVAGCGEAALMVEQRLDAAGERLLDGIDNDELSVRVFDFQLSIEHLVTVAAHVPAAELSAVGRAQFGTALSNVGAVLQEGTDRRAAARVGMLATDGARRDGSEGRVDELDRLLRELQNTVAGWRRIVDPQPGDAPTPSGSSPTADAPADQPDDESAGDGKDDEGAEDEPPQGRVADTARQAVQVGLAAALAVIVGEMLSSTRWFWAAIAAFVVFTGTSTSGETLSKGWQRVLGTLAGVGAGVVVAALVGGNTVAALILIVASLFLGVYLMRISSGWMIFFITTMLALLYGLLGRFSIGLLLLRLEETAAGAAIGVLVSFLVFPSSTRDAVRSGARDFLTDLGGLLEHLATNLTGERSTGSRAQAEASALRESFDALKSTAKALTDGLAGLGNRSGYRRTLRVLGACEHHARALARLADTAAGAAADPALCRALVSSIHGVRANVDAVAQAVDDDLAGGTVQPADTLLDALDRAADTAPGLDQHGLLAIGRHLRAIDQAVCGLATDHGAHSEAVQRVS